jgi:hypothetical protein
VGEPANFSAISGRCFSNFLLTVSPDLATKRGRPQAIEDYALLNNREKLLFALEENSGLVGWELRQATTLDESRRALRQITGISCDPLEKFTREPKRSSQEEFKQAIKLAEEAGQSNAAAQRALNDVLQKRDRARAAMPEARDPEAASEIHSSYEALERQAQQAFEDLRRANDKSNAAREDVAAQEAHLAQSALLDFIGDSRYAKTPLNFANAMAGLPLLGWRRSAQKCSEHPANFPSLTYEKFSILCRVFSGQLEDRDTAIERMKSFLLSEEPQTYAIIGLRSTWYYLKASIEQALSSEQIWPAMPYRIFAEYRRAYQLPQPDGSNSRGTGAALAAVPV